MNNSDLIRKVSVKLDMPIQQAEQAVDALFEAMTSGLRDSKRVELRGFGSFHIREYDGYLGRNPKTGESVSVAPKMAPFFKPGKEIRTALNKDDQ